MKPVLAALAVCVKDGKALLVKRRNPPDQGLWSFPGGKAEPGEAIEACATRELFEETGITATAKGYLGHLDVIGHDKDGALAYHYHLVAISCAYVNGVAQAADDAEAAEWVPYDDVLSGRLAMSKNVDTLLQREIAKSL